MCSQGAPAPPPHHSTPSEGSGFRGFGFRRSLGFRVHVQSRCDGSSGMSSFEALGGFRVQGLCV